MSTGAHAASPAPTAELRAAPRGARAVLLGCVLLVAVCGFVYELVIIALGTYLFGNSIYQVSIVLAAFVSAMGLGSLAAKPLQRRPVVSFAVIECALALLGGLSAMLLYGAFAWADVYQPVMLLVASAIGVLVGCEIPLLLVLMQRVREQDAGQSVADLLAADYLGAVVAGVSFPFVLLPLLGQIDAALAVGALNAVAGLVVVVMLARRRRALAVPLVAVLVVLGVAAAWSSQFEVSARQRLFDDPIVRTERSKYQEITITKSLTGGDVRLFLNGDLQFSSKDEYRYHEALVHPAMAGPHARVLILGGGDGLAAREVLRYADVERVVEVELDPEMVAIGRSDPRITALNRGALEDPRMQVVTRDAFGWLRDASEQFDVIVVDFPDPDDAGTAKLYSLEFYDGVRRRVLAPGGRMVVQSGSPYFAQKAFWGIETTVAAAGWKTVPYHVDVPTFGDWGFVLATDSARPPALALRPPPGDRLRFLSADVLRAATAFPPDRSKPDLEPSTLNRPNILGYEKDSYSDY